MTNPSSAAALGAAELAYRELDKILGFSESEPQLLKHFLGIQFSPVRTFTLKGETYNSVHLTQEPLSRLIVDNYKKQTGYNKLRAVATPGLPKSEETPYPDDTIEGKLRGS